MLVLMTLALFLMLLLSAFAAGIDRGRREIVREAYESVKPVKLENEKLRLLVRRLWRCSDIRTGAMFCEECLIEDEKGIHCPRELEMRELGIEVHV